ncbi:hypothetical protein QAD02_020577 [Eretmocerus hayati]|uniref:Uncharacterized protein n=1 Tax=Eretmocerus hayati TaxID=131215 RepID=A0ACC2PQB8_9HYME|nr:hypothetical protein QAD02_020577 [Eretmocerus hayati]
MFAPRRSTRYLVVLFVDYVRPDGRKTVELVPIGLWHQLEGVNFCSYPPDEDARYVAQWVEEGKSPEAGWTAWKVNIIKEAKNHDQGLRRLQRSYTREDFSSSADENVLDRLQSEPEPQMFDEDQIMDELMDLPPMFDGAGDTSTPNQRDSRVDESILPSDPSNIDPVSPDHFDNTNPDNVERALSSRKRRVTIEDLENFEIRVKADVKSQLKALRRGIQYDLQRSFRELATRTINQPLGESTQPLLSLQNLLPFEKLDDFEKFDQETQESVDKQNTLKTWMTRIVVGQSKINEAIQKILSGLMKKVVQQEHSGCGKMIKGKAKKNFSNTASFKCMLDVLLAKFTKESEGTIKTKTSRWFSGSGDREGGKKLRLSGQQSASSTSGAVESREEGLSHHENDS